MTIEAIIESCFLQQAQYEQGGVGFIARIPVYDTTREGAPFWGLLSSVMDTEGFYREAGLYDDELELQVAIRGRDAGGSSGGRFFGPPSVYEQDPVTEIINLPYGSWQLAAIPRRGWQVSSPYLWPSRAVALITTLLFVLLPVFKQRSDRQRLVLAGELRAANDRLTAVLDGMNGVVYVADMNDHEILYANPKTRQVFGPDLVGRKCWQVLRQEQTGPAIFAPTRAWSMPTATPVPAMSAKWSTRLPAAGSIPPRRPFPGTTGAWCGSRWAPIFRG